MCIQIERKLYSDSSKDYLSNVRERILILKDRGNPNLKVNIVLGEISTDDFATLEAKDLADEETKKKIQEGKEWSMNAYFFIILSNFLGYKATFTRKIARSRKESSPASNASQRKSSRPRSRCDLRTSQ